MAEFRDLRDANAETALMATNIAIGQVVAERYRITRKIGEGGMGAVYAAEHLTLGKHVALKVILPQFAGDGIVAARFAREALATGKLDHPHVASAMDYGVLPGGGAFLVMQLVKGTSLEETLQKHGRVSWPRACAIGAQVADALAAAHAQGIVHRDLKPENIMLEPRDDGSELVMVLDFGIALLHGVADRGGGPGHEEQDDQLHGKPITRVGAVIGTPGYMAPEQALGEPIDHRADLYAFGVVLWEMVSGKTLFDLDTVTEIVRAQILGEITPRLEKESGDPTLPDELQGLVDHLLARQPSDRPESAAYVRDVLRDLAIRATVDGDPRARVSTLSRFTPATGIDRVTHPTVPILSFLFPHGRTGWRVVAAGAVATLVLTGILLSVILLLRDPPVRDNVSAPHDTELVQELYERARQANRTDELARHVSILLYEEEKDVREQSAAWIVDYEPADQVEDNVRNLALLALASGCGELREALNNILELGDPRARASVQRLEDTPQTCRGRRRGRHVRNAHCYACVRSEIREILETFPVEGEVHVE